jgi:hypothetical protein
MTLSVLTFCYGELQAEALMNQMIALVKVLRPVMSARHASGIYYGTQTRYKYVQVHIIAKACQTGIPTCLPPPLTPMPPLLPPLLCLLPPNVCRTLEQLEWENSQQENSFWHDMMAMSYQSRSFAQHQDLDQCYLSTVKARERVMEAMAPETMREAFRRILPCPCRNRYTAITMMPQQPNLLQRLAFKCSTMLARFTAGSSSGAGAAAGEGEAGVGRGWQRSASRAASGRLASADSAGLTVPVGEEAAAAAAMAPGGIGSARFGAWGGKYGTGYNILAGVAVAAAAVGVGAVVWTRSRRA